MKILAVDDSFDWLNIHNTVTRGVFGENIEIVCASSAFEALNIYKDEYKENPFDLVITDLQMESDYEPMYAGEWLIKEILTLNFEQKILIISSTLNISQIANSFNVDYLSKRTIISDPQSYNIKLEEIIIT